MKFGGHSKQHYGGVIRYPVVFLVRLVPVWRSQTRAWGHEFAHGFVFLGSVTHSTAICDSMAAIPPYSAL